MLWENISARLYPANLFANMIVHVFGLYISPLWSATISN